MLKNQTESDDINNVKEFLTNYAEVNIIEADDGSVSGVTVEPTEFYYVFTVMFLIKNNLTSLLKMLEKNMFNY